MKIKEVNQHSKFSIFIILTLITSDIIAFNISHTIILTNFNTPSIIDYPIIIVLGILYLFSSFKRYNPSSLQSRFEEFKIISFLTFTITFVYLIYKISFKMITIQQSQHIVLLTLLFLFLVLLFRLIIRTIQKQLLKINIGIRRTVILASQNKGTSLLKTINKAEYSGYKIVGYFSYDSFDKQYFIKKFNLQSCTFDHMDQSKDFIINNKIREVVIAFDSMESNRVISLVSELRNMNVCIKVVPSMYDILSGLTKMHSVTGIPLIDINPNILTEFQLLLKRIIDILVSSLGLIISFPILLIVSILIKLSSKGPIIFKQERIGLNGKPFIVHKFRTMYENSEKETGPIWAKVDDPRITKVGNFIRKTRIDEFPQFYDVLIGSMSIVGPRPERIFFINKLKHKFPYYMRRLNVRPGVTGWAQIMGSYDTDLEGVENKLKLDFYYIENISIWLDIKIMIITFWVIISRKGQ